MTFVLKKLVRRRQNLNFLQQKKSIVYVATSVNSGCFLKSFSQDTQFIAVYFLF